MKNNPLYKKLVAEQSNITLAQAQAFTAKNIESLVNKEKLDSDFVANMKNKFVTHLRIVQDKANLETVKKVFPDAIVQFGNDTDSNGQKSIELFLANKQDV